MAGLELQAVTHAGVLLLAGMLAIGAVATLITWTLILG